MNRTPFPDFSAFALALAIALAPALLVPVFAADNAAGDPGKKKQTNRLAGEKSPYLLQHADNPVDWYPWGEEAFAKAKAENKPVFLSIGYSTCHWCHVMQHESFEDEETAAFLNKHFINIKLDREERPDIDRIYMNYQQAVNGGGGWPLSVFMTPARVPFFSGTYFPKEGGSRGISFMHILERVTEVWDQNHAAINEDSARILAQMKELFTAGADPDAEAAPITPEISLKAFTALAADFDPQFGGFGTQPKFPQPTVLEFLLEHYAGAGKAERKNPGSQAQRSLKMVETTLEKMALGGIFDHLGGGFHRYSVDNSWHVPHFEKMLYDQGLLASVYLDAYRITGNPAFEQIARSIFEYVERDLSHPGGAFYSAEDADSHDPNGYHAEKLEGAFYVWTIGDIEKHLGPEKAPIFIAAYDLTSRGNAPSGSDPFGEFLNKNILYRKKTDAELAEAFGKSEEEIRSVLATSRKLLLAIRSQRPRPSLDDKVIVAWNAIMISAYTKAYEVLGENAFLERAAIAAGFIEENLIDPETGDLLHSHREGPSSIGAFADDYALYIQALLDLYQVSQDTEWLALALRLQEKQFALFLDPDLGGFFDAPEAQTDLIVRLKDILDGAMPSSNAVSALNLIRLSALLKSERFEDELQRIFRLFAADLQGNPLAHVTLATAAARSLSSPAQIIVASAPGDDAGAEIMAGIRDRYLPNKVVLLLDGGKDQQFLAAQNDLLAAFDPIDGKPTLYLCRNYTCQKPTNDPKEIAAQLDQL